MGLLNRIRDAFRKPAPPALRNKPGGLAWIRGIPELEGRIVTTVCVYAGEFWAIDPQQHYRCTRHVSGFGGVTCKPGDNVTTIGIVDACLEPIPPVGDDAQDESLRYLPPVPTANPEKVA